MTGRWTRAVMWAQLRSVRSLVWAGLLLLVSVGMAFVPLLNLLGFGFALVMALSASIASADLAAAFVRRARRTERAGLERAATPGRTLARLWGAAALCNLALLVAPLVVISANALRVRNCDWAFGFESYLSLAVVSSLAGTSLGVVCALVAGDRRGLSNALPYLAILASAIAAVARFYTEPPIFVYNAFIGYWPGTPYDESIDFGSAFWASRMFQASIAVFALALAAVAFDVPSMKLRLGRDARPEGRRIGPAVLAIAGAAAAAWLWTGSGERGFAVDAGDIQAELGGRYETEHFVIYYPRDAELAERIELIAADHEFRLWQVTRLLDAEPGGKITSYYFASADQKARWTGARRVHVAKPWLREIYVDHQAFPHGVLRHEIAHVVAAEFGDPVFRVSVRYRAGLPLLFNPGLIEGLAVASDWPDRRGGTLTPHQSVRVMVEMGMAPPLEAVLSPQFLAFASSRSYTLAGSFVRYILERFGVDRVRALYRTGGDFMTALGRSQSEVATDWRQMIGQVELPPDAADLVREAFRRPGIVSRACPIAIARRQRHVQELYAERRFGRAAELMREVCQDAPGEPRHRLTLAGILERAGATDEAREIRAELAADADAVSTQLRAEAMLELAVTAYHDGDVARAHQLIERAAALTLPEDLARAMAAIGFALRHDGPAAPALRRYFFGASATDRPGRVTRLAHAAEMIRVEPELGLGHYLFGFNLDHEEIPADAAAALGRALDRGLPDPLLAREAAELLAKTAYLAGDDDALRRAAAILRAEDQPEVVRLRGADWLERLEWRRSR